MPCHHFTKWAHWKFVWTCEKTETKVSDNLLEGRKHDAGMHADSGLLTQYESFAFSPANLYLWRSCQYTLHSHFSAMLSSQPKYSHDCIENAQWNAYWEPSQIILSVAMLIRTKHPTQYSVGEMYIVCAPF